MDPPSHALYTIDDFLSEKRIAVRFSESAAYQELCEILIANQRDSSGTLQRKSTRPNDAIVYRHHDNPWVQKGPCQVLAELGYTIIEAEDFIDFIPDFDLRVSDIMNLLEEP